MFSNKKLPVCFNLIDDRLNLVNTLSIYQFVYKQVMQVKFGKYMGHVDIWNARDAVKQRGHLLNSLLDFCFFLGSTISSLSLDKKVVLTKEKLYQVFFDYFYSIGLVYQEMGRTPYITQFKGSFALHSYQEYISKEYGDWVRYIELIGVAKVRKKKGMAVSDKKVKELFRRNAAGVDEFNW